MMVLQSSIPAIPFSMHISEVESLNLVKSAEK